MGILAVFSEVSMIYIPGIQDASTYKLVCLEELALTA